MIQQDSEKQSIDKYLICIKQMYNIKYMARYKTYHKITQNFCDWADINTKQFSVEKKNEKLTSATWRAVRISCGRGSRGRICSRRGNWCGALSLLGCCRNRQSSPPLPNRLVPLDGRFGVVQSTGRGVAPVLVDDRVRRLMKDKMYLN